MKRIRKSNTFLIEMIIVILFFALSVAVITQLFATSHRDSTLSADTNSAMLRAESVAEQLRTLRWGEQELGDFLEAASGITEGDSQRCTLYYDKNWKQVQQEARYVLTVEIQPQQKDGGVLLLSDIRVERQADSGPEPLYSLRADRYLPNMGAAG